MGQGVTRPHRIEQLFRSAAGLLEAHDYKHGAEVLRQALVVSERSGAAECASLLEIAWSIASTCRMCHTEAEWHQHAHTLANERESELLEELIRLLQIANGHLPAVDVPARAAASLELASGPTSRPAGSAPDPTQLPRTRDARRVAAERGGHGCASDTAGIEAPHAAQPSLAFYCLGPFRVFQNGALIDQWSGLKGLSVLKYLACHCDRKTSRDALMSVFWPDAAEDAARRNLHQAIYSLRKSLRERDREAQYIQAQDNCYFFNPEIEVWVDCGEFETRVANARRHEAAGRIAEATSDYGIAECLYQGRFMEEDLYADWAEPQRRYLEQTYLEVGEHLAELYLDQGALAAAVALCHRILAYEPCSENAHRQLMRCYEAQGLHYLAVRQFQLCDATLRIKSGLKPSEQTTALYWRIAHRA